MKVTFYYIECLLYADGIPLVSHSLFGMQHAADICAAESSELDIQFEFTTV